MDSVDACSGFGWGRSPRKSARLNSHQCVRQGIGNRDAEPLEWADKVMRPVFRALVEGRGEKSDSANNRVGTAFVLPLSKVKLRPGASCLRRCRITIPPQLFA
jgi:hypothetical protein